VILKIQKILATSHFPDQFRRNGGAAILRQKCVECSHHFGGFADSSRSTLTELNMRTYLAA
jgi:hypothetical protein